MLDLPTERRWCKDLENRHFRGGIFESMKDTMKEMGENLVGTGPSAQASKKRKNAATEKTARISNKRSTRSSSREVPPQVDPTAGASENDGNDPPKKALRPMLLLQLGPPKSATTNVYD